MYNCYNSNLQQIWARELKDGKKKHLEEWCFTSESLLVFGYDEWFSETQDEMCLCLFQVCAISPTPAHAIFQPTVVLGQLIRVSLPESLALAPPLLPFTHVTWAARGPNWIFSSIWGCRKRESFKNKLQATATDSNRQTRTTFDKITDSDLNLQVHNA